MSFIILLSRYREEKMMWGWKKITEKHEGDQGPKRGEKESIQLVPEQNELWTTLCLVVEILWTLLLKSQSYHQITL